MDKNEIILDKKDVILNNIKYTFIIKNNKNNIFINCLKEKLIVGYFNIFSENLFISGSTHSLSISIEEEYQKLGLSIYLIDFIVKFIINNNSLIDLNMLFYIDSDASNGFWNNIGFKENRYGIDYKGLRNLEGKGYEKKITLRELQNYTYKKLRIRNQE